MLVELIVAALVLGMIGMGVLYGIAGSNHASANNKNRSVASSLAQQDQERLRAMKPSSLSNFTDSNQYTIGGVTYTVASRGSWLSDSSGTLSCSSGSATANYLKISSSVSWSNMGALKPIAVSSLVAPSSGQLANKGTLAIQVTDQANNGISNLPVTVGSPANLTDSTDTSGCTVFNAVDSGTYAVSFSQAGYVDTGGNNAISKNFSVIAGTTTTQQILYAQAGSIAASFDTKVGSASPVATTATDVTVSHNNLPAPGRRIFSAASAQNSISATSLFPFTSGYGVYSGRCAANDPTLYDSNYYTSNPGSVTVAPGGSYAVTVREPTIRLSILRNNGVGNAAYNTAHVVIKSTDSGCSELANINSSNANIGSSINQALPFGNYSACADDGTRKITNSSVANTTANGPAAGVITLTIPTSGFSNLGKCT
jgi:Tfp pilus assembly protein PilV